MATPHSTLLSRAWQRIAGPPDGGSAFSEATANPTDSLDPAARVEQSAVAFEHFTPSGFTQRENGTRTYLEPGENLATTMERVVKDGVEVMSKNGDRRALKLRLTDGVKKQIHKGDGEARGGTVVLSEILSLLNLKLPGTPSLRDDPALTKCAAEKVAQQHIDEIEGGIDKGKPIEANADGEKKDVDGNGNKRQDGNNGYADADRATIMGFVGHHVRGLMENIGSPEEQPTLVSQGPGKTTGEKNSPTTFELRSGPSDVTSYHDFNSLQIAFEHVWSEVFDERLHQVGRELYETYIAILAAMGRPPGATSVSSVDDIKTLMSHARDLGRVTDIAGNTTYPGVALPSDPAGAVQRVAGTFGAVRDSLVAALPNGWAGVVDTNLQRLKTDIDSAQNASQSGMQQQMQRLATTVVSVRTAMTAAVGGNWSSIVDTLMVPISLQIQWVKAAVAQPAASPQDRLAGEVQHVAGMLVAVRESLVAKLTSNWAGVVDANLQPVKADIDAAGNATSLTGIQQQIQHFTNSLAVTRSVMTATVGPNWSSTVDTLMVPLTLQIQWAVDAAVQPEAVANQDDLGGTLPGATRLAKLLDKIELLLQQRYSFTVFQEKTSNFGIMVTYRQTWTPEQYQVGDLVSTIPLAPRETRRYTTKHVTKKSRAAKEVENNLNSNKSESASTSRVDREIVARAENRTNFKLTADGSFGTEANKIHATGETGGDDGKFSQDTKKNFHEAVLKSAEEYKHDTHMEIETTFSSEMETTTYQEIQNPNDELTVTYLFYELQRTYHIAERIHQVTPVVLVANGVPRPDEIDDAWLIQNDWILRRVLLDDSFRPALEYLTTSFVGDELNLQFLDNNAQAQRQVVDAVKSQVASQLATVEASQRDLSKKIDAQGGLEFTEGILGTVKKVFDPLGFTGQTVTGTSQGMQTIADYAQETLDRAEREKLRLLDQLSAATTALQVAVDKLTAATREHYNKVAEIDRLRVHVKENILYYMQAIWNHEPPDQRYFRVFQIDVPIVEPKTTNTALTINPHPDWSDALFDDAETARISLDFGDFEIKWKPLVEVADLDNVLGYKGNYAVYPLKQNNYLTYHMMQNYLDVADEIKIRDPDDIANYSVSDLQEFANCLYKCDKDAFKLHKNEIKQMIIDRLMSGLAEDDRVIVPTDSLYIEALVGTHPLLEDFKLLHRALDVKKVQSEVRHAELENIRLAARALKGEDQDPDIEKMIVVQDHGRLLVDTE